MKHFLLAGTLILLAPAACRSGEPSGDPAAAYQRGVAALEAGDASRARIEFLNATKVAPNDPRPHVGQARVHLASSDGLAAEAALTEARRLGASRAETAHLLAEAALLQDDAERALEEATHAAPAHRAASARIRGNALAHLGKRPEAKAAFAEALAATPDDVGLLLDTARFRRSIGEIGAAAEAVDHALGRAPRHVAALTLRGELARKKDGPAVALAWFDKALAIEPGNVPALLERAATLADVGATRKMLADTRAVLAASPNNPSALFLQAKLAAQAGKYALARSLYQRTGGTLDERPAAMMLLATIHYHEGNLEQAGRHLDKVVAAQPGNRAARRLLATVHWKKGDASATAETLRPVAARPDADVFALTLLGSALQREGKAKEAAPYFARAAALTAGDALLQAGKWQQAADAFEAIRRQTGDEPALLNNLAWAYAELGRYDRAVPLARKAWTLDSSDPRIADTLGWLLVKSNTDRAEGVRLLRWAARAAPANRSIQEHLAAASG